MAVQILESALPWKARSEMASLAATLVSATGSIDIFVLTLIVVLVLFMQTGVGMLSAGSVRMSDALLYYIFKLEMFQPAK